MNSMLIIRVAVGGAIIVGGAYLLIRFYWEETEGKLDIEEWKAQRETWRHGASYTPPQQERPRKKSVDARATETGKTHMTGQCCVCQKSLDKFQPAAGQYRGEEVHQLMAQAAASAHPCRSCGVEYCDDCMVRIMAEKGRCVACGKALRF